MDEAGFIGDYNATRMENSLDGLYRESGADIRFIFARERFRETSSRSR